jgi:hypothetical protein
MRINVKTLIMKILGILTLSIRTLVFRILFKV